MASDANVRSQVILLIDLLIASGWVLFTGLEERFVKTTPKLS